MATKTITIDMEAYRRLSEVKRDGESFSQTIHRLMPPVISTEELIKMFRQAEPRLSEGFFRGVEAAVASRQTDADLERINGLLGHHGAVGPDRSRRATKTSRRRAKNAAA